MSLSLCPFGNRRWTRYLSFIFLPRLIKNAKWIYVFVSSASGLPHYSLVGKQACSNQTQVIWLLIDIGSKLHGIFSRAIHMQLETHIAQLRPRGKKFDNPFQAWDLTITVLGNGVFVCVSSYPFQSFLQRVDLSPHVPLDFTHLHDCLGHVSVVHDLPQSYEIVDAFWSVPTGFDHLKRNLGKQKLPLKFRFTMIIWKIKFPGISQMRGLKNLKAFQFFVSPERLQSFTSLGKPHNVIFPNQALHLSQTYEKTQLNNRTQFQFRNSPVTDSFVTPRIITLSFSNF